MAALTLFDGDFTSTGSALLTADGPALEPADVRGLTGWDVKPYGLCRGEVCNPARFDGGPITLTALAAALHRPLAIEVLGEAVVAVLGEPGGSTVHTGQLAPTLELRNVDGETIPVTGRGRKTAVVVWSTWCGCRYELPSWQALAAELADGLDLVTVALDDDSDAVRKWTSRVDGLPVAIDPDHRVSDVFGVVNVPATIWLDESGRVVKPPTIAPGDDQFAEFTEVESGTHHEALRQWVHGGPAPEAHAVEETEAVRTARAERRLAAWLHRNGHVDAAAQHFAAAIALAPLDFSIRRSSMPARGQDPFVGEEFMQLWQEWSAAGRPGYQATPTR